MAQQWSGGTESGILRKNRGKDKFDDLLVFGYACKLFRDDDKAQYIDHGKHLIPWMGDDKLKVDRYDCRGHLSDLKPYEASREGYDAMRWLGLSESERKLEQLCDEERYYSLQINEEEEQLYKEEEEKRKKTNEFQYSYDVPCDPDQAQEGIPTVPEANLDDEEYVPPVELDVPVDIPIPKTVKESARIERTAFFVSEQGMQMEILIKTKQGDNPNFSFLNQSDPLFKYYRHVLSAIKSGRYKIQSSKKNDEAAEDAAQEKTGDGHYLHPSLVAASSQSETHPPVTTVPTIPYKPSANCTYSQLVNRIQGAPLDHSPAEQIHSPVQPQDAQASFSQMTVEQQQQYYQYYYAAQYYEYYKQLAHYQQSQGENVPLPEVPLDPNMQHYLQQMAYAQYIHHQQQQPNNSYAQIVSNVKDTSNPYAALLANLQQNMPVPVAQPSMSSPNTAAPAPPLTVDTQNGIPVTIKPSDKPDSKPETENKPLLSLAEAYGSGTDSEDSESDSESSSASEESQKPAEEFPVPTGEVQVVIDKMASYVAKNGQKFEEIVKAKEDSRFDFLLETHEYNKYYRNKIAELTGEKKVVETKKGVKDEEKDKKAAVSPAPPKKEKKVITPVCFSIKKPKEDAPKEIKSALPVEESDDEEETSDTAATTSNNTSVATTTVTPSISRALEAMMSPPSSSQEKSGKDNNTKAEPIGESVAEKNKTPEGHDPPLSTILTQCMKKNGILDTDDPILEMIDLTDDLEERKDAKRAQDRIKDKLAAAAREKLASVARDKALQLERKKKAAAFLKLKSVLAAEQAVGSKTVKEPSQVTSTSKDSSRRSSTESEAYLKEKAKDTSKEKSSEREKSLEIEREVVLSRRDKKKGKELISRRARERDRTRNKSKTREKERSRSRSKSKKKDKASRSRTFEEDIDKYRLSDLEEYACTPKKIEKIEVVQIDDSDSEEGEIKKKKKSKKKKGHKRKHSKHDSRSRKKSKKKRKRSESTSSDSS